MVAFARPRAMQKDPGASAGVYEGAPPPENGQEQPRIPDDPARNRLLGCGFLVDAPDLKEAESPPGQAWRAGQADREAVQDRARPDQGGASAGQRHQGRDAGDDRRREGEHGEQQPAGAQGKEGRLGRAAAIAQGAVRPIRARHRKATVTSPISAGTSTRGPITAANAAPDAIPNTPMATAIASSKLLPGAVTAGAPARG